MEKDAFEEIAEGKVVILGEGFEYFQDALFHADAGLDSSSVAQDLDETFHGYLCTRVHR